METLASKFGFASWLAVIASRQLRPQMSCEDRFGPLFELRMHVSDLQSGVVPYIESQSASFIDNFERSARRVEVEAGDFCRAVRSLFGTKYPTDTAARRRALVDLLADWDRSNDPWPNLEEMRKGLVASIGAAVERRLLSEADEFIRCTLTEDPFAGNVALKKLRGRIKGLK